MTTKDNLPEPVKQETAEVVVYEPPAMFEVIDRGPGEKYTFESFGDSFIGIYQGYEEAVNKQGEPFIVSHFVGADGLNYDIQPGAGIKHVISKMLPGEWYRLTYTFDMDTGKQSPMKCFTVEVGR